MKGFFSNPDKIEDLTKVVGNKELAKEKKGGKVYNCNSCLRCSHSCTFVLDEEGHKVPREISGAPALGVQGEGKKGIMIVAEELSEYGANMF